ncbi:respiratory nitrate reductase subunit gamma [Chloroflexota bacterium]
MTTLLSYLIIVFGYLAILIFILGMAYRIWSWKHLPTGFSWGTFPQPTKWVVTSVIWRALAWPNLFRADTSLWIGAMVFHIGILLLFVGHLGNFVDMLSFTNKLGLPDHVAYQIGVYAGTVTGIALLFFFLRRILATKAKQISSFADHFILWFLLVVVLVGIYARLFDEVSSEVVRRFAISVVTFKPALPPGNTWFLTHTLLAEIFIIYAVASKPIHLVGQWFTQYIIVSEKR